MYWGQTVKNAKLGIKNQASNRTRTLKKRGILSSSGYCCFCHRWCKQGKLQYYHPVAAMDFYVIPLCAACKNKEVRKRRRRMDERVAGQLEFPDLGLLDIDSIALNRRVRESIYMILTKGRALYNHRGNLVKYD
jgi:hypothetical protein